MGLYSLSVRTTATASGAACAELRSSASDRLRIREIEVTIATAVASIFGLGRPAAIGVTPTSPVTVLAEDFADAAGTGVVALAWGTGPTSPTAFFRRCGLPASIGAGRAWGFWNGPGLIVPVSSSIVVWNLQLNATADITFVLDE